MFGKRFPFFRQLEEADCGPVCLKMVADFYKKDIDIDWLKNKFQITKLGVGLIDIENIATALGFKAVSLKTTLHYLQEHTPFPCILLWGQDHFVILHSISTNKKGISHFNIADPAYGLIKLKQEKFLENWHTTNGKGIAMFLEPAINFYDIAVPSTQTKSFNKSWAFIKKYLQPHKKYLLLIALFLAITTVITWIFPTMIQKMIDEGIKTKDSNIIWAVLFSQAALIIGQVLSESFRNLF